MSQATRIATAHTLIYAYLREVGHGCLYATREDAVDAARARICRSVDIDIYEDDLGDFWDSHRI